jgi:uncharacterized protein (UPF0335 family)
MARRKQNGEESSPKAIANDEAARYADRAQALEVEKRELVVSLNEVYAEAADRGFPKKALKEVVKRRLETPEAQSRRIEFEEALEDMLSRLGMLADTPLGQAAATIHQAHANPQ